MGETAQRLAMGRAPPRWGEVSRGSAARPTVRRRPFSSRWATALAEVAAGGGALEEVTAGGGALVEGATGGSALMPRDPWR
jgi:hypothetical protein